jgi:putative Mg2+ transporter-C (MgtC) family protein
VVETLYVADGLHDELDIEALTTSASILMTSAIGISVALGQFMVATGVTMLALLVLRVLRLPNKRLG